MSGQYWADNAAADVTAPDSSQLEMGLIEGKPITIRWVNWVLKLLHAAYVLGTYFISVIKIGTPNGSSTNLTVKTNDGATTLITITGTETEFEKPVHLDSTAGSPRIYLKSGPRIKHKFTGGVGTFYVGYDTGGNSAGIISTVFAWVFSGAGTPRSHNLFGFLASLYNTTDDAESATVLYKDVIMYAKLQTANPGTSPSNSAAIKFGYITDSTGVETVLSTSSSSMGTINGDNDVVLGSASGVFSHDFNTKDRTYFVKLEFTMGSTDIVVIKEFWCSVRSYTIQGG
jgi:hypothetical protein